MSIIFYMFVRVSNKVDSNSLAHVTNAAISVCQTEKWFTTYTPFPRDRFILIFTMIKLSLTQYYCYNNVSCTDY